jgi:hypothetical protein
MAMDRDAGLLVTALLAIVALLVGIGWSFVTQKRGRAVILVPAVATAVYVALATPMACSLRDIHQEDSRSITRCPRMEMATTSSPRGRSQACRA